MLQFFLYCISIVLLLLLFITLQALVLLFCLYLSIYLYVGDFILTRQQKHVSMIPMSSGILRSFTRMASSFKKMERQDRKNEMETDKERQKVTSVQFTFKLKLAIFRIIINITSIYKTK